MQSDLTQNNNAYTQSGAGVWRIHDTADSDTNDYYTNILSNIPDQTTNTDLEQSASAAYQADIINSIDHATNNTKGTILDSTTPNITFSTFNTAGFHGVDVTNELDNIFTTTDIIGTQEQDETELANTIRRHSQTHGVIVGAPNSSDPPEYSPIFFNKEKFDVIETQSVDLGAGRVGTLAVLRDKETGALTAVENMHISSPGVVNPLERFNQANTGIAALNDINSKYNLAGMVFLGDLNLDNFTSDTFNVDPGTLPEGVETLEGRGVVFDHIVVINPPDTYQAQQPQITDGGASDHHIVSRTINFDFNEDQAVENRSLQALNLGGAIVYEHDNFGGEANIIGFGSTGDQDFTNDAVSSIWQDDDSRTFSITEHNPSVGEGPGRVQVLQGSVTSLTPFNFNDITSYFRFGDITSNDSPEGDGTV